MGYYDGVVHNNKGEDQVKFSFNDFHFLNNILHINKNLKFILHPSQYSGKFKITNDVLDINKDKIEINPKWIISLDSTGTPNGNIIVDNNDKLKLNYTSDFFIDYNSLLWVNLGAGLTRSSDNRIIIALAKCNLKFVNNQLCLDMDAMINHFNAIKLHDKERLRLYFNADNVMKDSTGKLWFNLNNPHITGGLTGNELNIDNDTIRYDTKSNNLISSIDKYVGSFGKINSGDIYLDSNKKMRLNINNYVDDNVGSKVIMNTNNKIDLDIVDQTACEVYVNSNNKLVLRFGNYLLKDSNGHFFAHVNQDHGLNWSNYKLNLDVSLPLEFVNKKLSLGYNPYIKLTNDKLDLDITKLKTDIVIPKINEGIKLNDDGTLSIDCSVLTTMINIGSLSGLKIVGNELIIDEDMMSKKLIRLYSNQPNC